MLLDLKFEILPENRIQESYEILERVAAKIKQSGRKQRIANIDFKTYQKWQGENANYVVLCDNEIAGLVTIRKEVLLDWPDYVHLGEVHMMRSLATNPSYSGKGVGEFAVGKSIERFGENPIFLDCVTEFLPAYYASLGFKVLSVTTVTKPVSLGTVEYEICLMASS